MSEAPFSVGKCPLNNKADNSKEAASEDVGAKTAAAATEPETAAATLGGIGLQQFAPYLMNRIMGRYNQTLRDELGRQGLSTPKMRTLAILSVMDGLRINELSVYAVTEQSTLSRVLDAMETDELIRRQPAADDNRVRHIFITDHGRTVFNAMWPTMLASSEQMFVDIDIEERERFIATLQKILRNIRKHSI